MRIEAFSDSSLERNRTLSKEAGKRVLAEGCEIRPWRGQIRVRRGVRMLKVTQLSLTYVTPGTKCG